MVPSVYLFVCLSAQKSLNFDIQSLLRVVIVDKLLKMKKHPFYKLINNEQPLQTLQITCCFLAMSIGQTLQITCCFSAMSIGQTLQITCCFSAISLGQTLQITCCFSAMSLGQTLQIVCSFSAQPIGQTLCLLSLMRMLTLCTCSFYFHLLRCFQVSWILEDKERDRSLKVWEQLEYHLKCHGQNIQRTTQLDNS